LIQLLTPKSEYTIDYQRAIDYATTQSHIFWTPDEIEVEKDLHDIRTNFSEAEYHGIVSTLKLFTIYELKVGEDYWSGYITKIFPRPDIQRMANCFSYFEINVHAPFYNKINEVLGLDNDEFYNSYLDDPILKNRMEWIGKRVSKKDTDYDRLKSVAVFSMIEGAILYSSFAFLKHFQSEGKNKLVNVTAGINFSVKDENIHSEAGAWLFKTYLNELSNTDEYLEIHDLFEDKLNKELVETAHVIYEHECDIINKIFEKGEIKGINSYQLKEFVKHRLNLCLKQLGLREIFSIEDTTIESWFYKNINSSKLHDFFVKQGNEYSRNWKELGFTWKT
jgi:ribonucleotide reductase beta subunit family protein with ferritin-like domain